LISRDPTVYAPCSGRREIKVDRSFAASVTGREPPVSAVPNIKCEAVYAGKAFSQRVTGRFYTPMSLADDLAARVAEAAGPRASYSLCDPFCGDGRLAVALLRALVARYGTHPMFEVRMLDLDAKAVSAALDNVQQTFKDLDVYGTVSARVEDSFAMAEKERFSAVITNPPWEHLKPDSREIKFMSADEAARYRHWLRRRGSDLISRFPEARPAGRQWGGWDINLARCGWALAMRSCAEAGVLGIVLPGSLMGDEASAPLRSHVFRHMRLRDIAVFPAEARLFKGVDQPVVSATFAGGTEASHEGTVRLFGSDRLQRGQHCLPSEALPSANGNFDLPLAFGSDRSALLDLFDAHPQFLSLEGPETRHLWAGRELDETRVADKLERSTARPFLKGRMIQRHRIVEKPSLSVKSQYVPLRQSPLHHRIVWRDVARASQARRMITAVIPPGWIAGNSLHVAYFKDGDLDRLHALYAVLSSLSFEFQVRSRATTGHMSLGTVRKAHVPDWSESCMRKLASISRIVSIDLKEEVTLEVEVAKAYRLQRDDFAELLGAFSKLDVARRDALLNHPAWRS